MSEIAPGFLIAVPQLGDPNFSRGVILMLEHTPEGALGIMVNRPTKLTLGDVGRVHGMKVDAAAITANVFTGGPVEPERGFLLHEFEELAEAVKVQDELFVSSSLDSLRTLLEGSGKRYRLCLGYAGWGAGQLEQEMKEGAWIVAPATTRHVLETPPKSAWEAVLRGMGIDPAMLLHSAGLH